MSTRHRWHDTEDGLMPDVSSPLDQTCGKCGLRKIRAGFAWEFTLIFPDGTRDHGFDLMPLCRPALLCDHCERFPQLPRSYLCAGCTVEIEMRATLGKAPRA